MVGGLPLSEAALRRRRRQRRRAAACGSGSGGVQRLGCSGVQDSEAGRHVPGESGGGGGGGYPDVRGHVVAALRCIAEALEFQGYDVGQYATQQVRAEDTTAADFSWNDVSGVDITTMEYFFSAAAPGSAVAQLTSVFPGTVAAQVKGCLPRYRCG